MWRQKIGEGVTSEPPVIKYFEIAPTAEEARLSSVIGGPLQITDNQRDTLMDKDADLQHKKMFDIEGLEQNELSAILSQHVTIQNNYGNMT